MPDRRSAAWPPAGTPLRVVDANHLLMEMFENKNGKEAPTMQMEYTRVK